MLIDLANLNNNTILPAGTDITELNQIIKQLESQIAGYQNTVSDLLRKIKDEDALAVLQKEKIRLLSEENNQLTGSVYALTSENKSLSTQLDFANRQPKVADPWYGRCPAPAKRSNTNCGHTASTIHYDRVIGSVWHKN